MSWISKVLLKISTGLNELWPFVVTETHLFEKFNLKIYNGLTGKSLGEAKNFVLSHALRTLPEPCVVARGLCFSKLPTSSLQPFVEGNPEVGLPFPAEGNKEGVIVTSLSVLCQELTPSSGFLGKPVIAGLSKPAST